MRNLKKILALVLALVMSLSLMATAGATDFTDADSISDVFQESVDVLNGLKVFQGYEDGAFRPDTPIKRSEVAVIIYRIATGDVEDSQVGIYKDYNKFKDVTGSHWAAGYINYCANAEYIKGVSSTKFEPEEYVTGYQALAMILRAIGYDKNGEFTGRDWHIQTAATARQRGVIENIAEGLLGQAATREMVAEILCKTILVDEVAYTPAFGYQIQEGKTLAYDTFQMEKLTGVVMANEYANLNVGGSSPLADGRTELVTFDGDSYTMEVESGRDDLGESRYVYVVPVSGTTRFTPVTGRTYDTGLNNVYGKDMNEESGAATTVAAAAASKSITGVTDADHFINYDQATEWTARIRIEYVMNLRESDFDAITLLNNNGGTLTRYNTDGTTTVYTTSQNAGGWSTQLTNDLAVTHQYRKVINAFTKLSDDDWANLRTIFGVASRTNLGFVTGEVYTGTWTGTGGAPDVSDEMRWEDFVAVNLETRENRKQVESNGLGNTLKIIDNDNDHVADYVLQTIYTVAKIASNGTTLDVINTRLTDGDAVNNVSGQPIVNDGEGDLAVGDVVVYAVIDGNIRAQKAATETAKINTVRRSTSATTASVDAEGTTYNESWVHTHSDGLTSGVNGMVGNTTYTMYFDLYGNLAAYTEGVNGGLVLITNGWYNSTISGPEYAVQAYLDGSLQTVNVTTNGGLFINNGITGNNNWGNLKNSFGAARGTNNPGTINFENKGSTAANPVRTIVANLDGSILTPVDKTYLYSQQLRVLDMNNNVIPLRDNATVSFGQAYRTEYVDGTAYQVPDGANVEVRGLSNTVYYVVYPAIGTDTMTGGTNVVVRQYVGYDNVPSINRTYIEDVYAVGAQATATVTGGTTTYYTAQVVVIECNNKYTGHMSDSEQVFIPDFTTITSNIGIETVTMIRGNGELTEVQVDMSHSDFGDYYDTAGNVVRGTRVRGLYFMDPSDTDPNVYVVRHMTPADIRANNYLAGYVRESWNTATNNYAQVEMMVRPATVPAAEQLAYVTDFSSSVARAQATYPVAPAANSGMDTWQSKAITSNSKTYTYGGSTATLVEAPVYNVLTQDRLDDAGTTISGINEKWVVPTSAPGIFTNANRNEVLVRYDNSGNVIWAVSFAENATAQQVWWNSLPAASASAGVVFRGTAVPAGATTVSVPHASALGNALLDLDAFAGTITSYSIMKWNGATNRYDLVVDEDGEKVEDVEQRYLLRITLNNGATIQEYTLIKEAAETGANLTTTTGNANLLTAATKTLNIGAGFGTDGLSVKEYLDRFTVDAGATAEWNFMTKGGTAFSVSGKNVKTAADVPAYGTIPAPYNVTMSEIAYVTVRVTAERGGAYNVYRSSSAPAATLSNTSGVTVASEGSNVANGGKVFAGSTLTLTAPSAGTITVTARDASGKTVETKDIEVTSGDLTKTYEVPATATGTITVTFKADTTSADPTATLELGSTTGLAAIGVAGIVSDSTGSMTYPAGKDLGNTGGQTTVYVEIAKNTGATDAKTYQVKLTNKANPSQVVYGKTFEVSVADQKTGKIVPVEVTIPSGKWNFGLEELKEAKKATFNLTARTNPITSTLLLPEVTMSLDGEPLASGTAVSFADLATKTLKITAPAGYTLNITGNTNFTVTRGSGNEWTIVNNHAAADETLIIDVTAASGYALVKIENCDPADVTIYKDKDQSAVLENAAYYALPVGKEVLVTPTEGRTVTSVGTASITGGTIGGVDYDDDNTGARTDRETGYVLLPIKANTAIVNAASSESQYYFHGWASSHGANVLIGYGFASPHRVNVHWLTEEELTAMKDQLTFTITKLGATSAANTDVTVKLAELMDYRTAPGHSTDTVAPTTDFWKDEAGFFKLHTCTAATSTGCTSSTGATPVNKGAGSTPAATTNDVVLTVEYNGMEIEDLGSTYQ